MNCYFCEAESAPGGMHLRVLTADGVCHHCGVAVCRHHGRRGEGRERVLLCQECAEVTETNMEERETLVTLT